MSKQTLPADLWRNYPVRYNDTRPATLITWSKVHVAPSGYESQAPYIVAIVAYSDDTNACVQLTDVAEEDLSHGMKLRPIFRKIFDPDNKGVIPYGTKYTKV